MKKTLIAITAILAAGALTAAAPLMQKVHDSMHHMALSLNLTPEQGMALHGRIMEFNKAKDTTLANPSLSTEQKRAKVANLQVKAEGDVKKILTPAQVKSLQSHGGMAHLFSANHAQAMTAHIHEMIGQLGLNPDQESKVSKIFDETFATMGNLMNDNTLSPDAKKTAVANLHEGAMKKMQEVLSPEQFTKLQQMFGHK